MSGLLLIHIVMAILLIVAVVLRFILAVQQKNPTQLRVGLYAVSILQILTGVGLLFYGASLTAVCLGGLSILVFVFLTDIAVNRLVAYENKSN